MNEKLNYEATAAENNSLLDIEFNPITVADILEDVNTNTLCKTSEENASLFIAKKANVWMEQAKYRPTPKMLFGEFWFEGELCILFADTNVGKSILAVQIGNSISKQQEMLMLNLQAIAQKVLYFDFELSDKQFENRYSANFHSHYNFNDNFIRVEVNPDATIPEGLSFEDFLLQSLEQSIIQTEAKVLIIDNLTYLKNETEKAKDALPLMKHLKSLKVKYGLSILALAHTPKRDLTKPITKNDLQGSKMLINFCDSAFTVGESCTDKSLRYLKQIKQRNTEQIYDTENVLVCQIVKPDNFLQFEFINIGNESEHLKQQSEKNNEEIVRQINEMKEQGKSLREIASQLGISHMKVSRLSKN